MRITGKTKITGIIGYPIEHTLSPAMHNAAFESLGLDYCYIPFKVHPDDLENAIKAIRALQLKGINVTIPHKEKVMPFLDETNKEAQFIGAVNTIVHKEEEGRLIGFNTDGRGFLQSLSEKDISIEGKDVLVIGAGGAARAICYYICQKAQTLTLYGRTKERVHALVNDLNNVNNNVDHLHDIEEIKKFHIIINATPLGMQLNDPLPLDVNLLTKKQIVCDLIYRKTKLIIEAERKGCTTVDGSGMLLWQGVYAFELWTGKKPDVAVMRKAIEANR